jgi:DNA-3-methyladenine glycosylase
MLNVVTGIEGSPGAVLIRAMWPVEGLELMERNRSRPAKGRLEKPLPVGWTDGPAKLCQALGITGRFNGMDLCDPESELKIEAGTAIPDEDVTIGPRVGIDSVPEPWKSMSWRFRTIKELFHEDHEENHINHEKHEKHERKIERKRNHRYTQN